jgi:FKBP-type peptidyl-prolyl cis-trans isomerase FkpA
MLFICKNNYPMKKILAVCVTALFILASCAKTDNKCRYTDSTVIAPASEVQALKDSLTAHGITATKDPSGFFYTINTQGAGASVTNLCTVLTVAYKGTFFNGQVFDATKFDTTVTPNVPIPVDFQLGGVIVGWQKALPLINKGGDITLYIPPSLAYGPSDVKNQQTGAVVIPGGSNLIFTVHVVDIQ